jgi:NADPH-dependent curcumin reductase CurA
VMRALGAGVVVASKHPDFPEGATVTGTFGVQEYAESDGAGVLVVDPAAAPVPTHLSLLGMTGLTAYFGLFDVGALQDGETVAVSGAAGAVGSVVGQLAKIRGCRVIGIAGGPEKCRWLVDELGFDAAIDYRAENVNRALRTHAPDGIDVYFDNVGGDHLDAAFALARKDARFAICGMIEGYNAAEPMCFRFIMRVIAMRIRVQGFIYTDYMPRMSEFHRDMGGWIASGQVKARDTVVEGLEKTPEAFLGLFEGANTGKMLVKL